MDKEKKRHYLSVLEDLEKERQELSSHIEWLKNRLNLSPQPVGEAIEPVPNKPTSAMSPITFKEVYNEFFGTDTQSPLGLTDTAENILRNNGRPLHAKSILAELHKRGRTKTTIKSLAGSMPQDSRKRFENLGRNVWALSDWPEEIKTRYRTVVDGETPDEN